MSQYVARRMVIMIVQVVLVATIVFLMMRLVPGDPARAILGENANDAAIATMRERLGLNEPLHTQYSTWLGSAAQGDLGKSVISGRSVSGDIQMRFWNSVEIIVASIVLSLIVAIPLGTLAAIRANRAIDYVLSTFAIVGLSLPGFVVGTVLVMIFAVKLKILPQTVFVSWSSDPIGHIKLLILPSITLALGNTAVIFRMMRSSMLEVVRRDYIRTARAKGLGERRIVARHGLRNAINPVVSIVGLEASTLLGGMVIVEAIFNWPGLSSLLISGVLSRDYPVVQGVVLVIAVMTILISVAVDIAYGLLDPRIRLT